MADFVSEVKSTTTAGDSSGYPAIPKIKIKFASYSSDTKERIKKPKIVKQEVEQSQSGGSGGVGCGSKGQCQTCHQCRQSIYSNKGTFEVKIGKERLKCSRCTRFWCERCLINRYGVVMVTMDPNAWLCPFCRKNCNCSVCRKKEGKLATGILTYVAKNAGFQSVSDFLDKGTDDVAKVLQWKPPPVKPRTSFESTEKRNCSPEKMPTELKVCLKRPISSRIVSGNIAASHYQEAVSPLACRVRGDSCGKDIAYLGNSRIKWRRLDHSSYSIVIREDDPLIREINNCRGTSGWIRNETVIIDTESDFTETTIPFQVSSLPFTLTNQMPMQQTTVTSRPLRTRKHPGRYSTSEYDMDMELLVTDVSSEENRDSLNRTPIFNFKPEIPIGLGSSWDTLPTLEPSQSHRELSTLSLFQFPNDVNVGHPLVPGKDDALNEQSSEDKNVGVVHSTEQAYKANSLPVRIEKVEQLKLAATLEEQLLLARKLILKAQRDVRRRDKGKGGRTWLVRDGVEGVKGERTMEKVKNCNGGHDRRELSIVEDSPEACKRAEVPPLPTLPPFPLPLPPFLIPSFLFISEFLFTFQEHLGLRRKMNGYDLCHLLSGGRGLAEVYKRLLNLVVVESSELWKEMRTSSRQRDLEKVAKKCLLENGRNGFLTCADITHTTEESLIILSHLCHNVLENGSLDNVLEESRVMVDQLQRDHRTRERGKGREVREELRSMRENGGSSFEEIDTKRKEYVAQLDELRRENELEYYSSCLVLRNEPLGRDRHDRVYWHLQSLSGVVVECSPLVQDDGRLTVESSLNGGGSEDCSIDDMARNIEEVMAENSSELALNHTEGGTWFIINSAVLIQEVIDCLHPKGRREKKLKDSLLLLKESLSN